MRGPGVSPYSFPDTLRWPVRYAKPSMHLHSRLVPQPATREFGDPRVRERKVRLVFFGDLMCMPGDRVPAVSHELRSLVASADLVIGNCEAPVTPEPPRPSARYAFTFRMSEAYLGELLQRLGADPTRCALSVANNHAGDRGPPGVDQTLKCFADLGVRPLGVATPAGVAPVLDVGGLRVAATAWTHWMNREPGGRSPLRAADVDLSRAPRGPGSPDLRIALPHWDYEFCHYPAPETRRLARRCLEAGFDLVVGHHPHVIQPIECLGSQVCAYSLGNLNGPPLLLRASSSRLLGVLEVELASGLGSSKGGEERCRLSRYELHPFVQLREGREVRIGPFAEAPHRLRRRLESRMRRLFPVAGESARA